MICGLQFPKNTSVFSEQNLRLIRQNMEERTFAAGSYLFWEGDEVTKCYFLKSGGVHWIKQTDNGKPFVSHVFLSGDLVAELAPLQHAKHNYSAKVVNSCVAGVILLSDLEKMIERHSSFAVDMYKWMCLMNRLTQTKLRDLLMYGKTGALCSTLIRLANSYGIPDGEVIHIRKKLTHLELAAWIGSSREGVNRILSDLRKKKVIDYYNGYILIKNLSHLQEICHCDFCPKEICRI
ncbi:Crp/Fnr family transcriptional regulator [Laceyella putida]|uniref:Crp/Fnr family transcriptional regulator n=1 Tax=Laceyella putida TaxID=110101 RepID=A0ABW2RQ12_9BACL